MQLAVGAGSAAAGMIRSWLRSVRPDRRHLKADVVAGLPGAISSVPDGMASAVLAGVNPVYGLYASFAGPIAGGLAASTRMMVITTTSAAALAAGSALSGVEEQARPGALVLLTLMAGGLMVAAGVLGLGRYTRFVSHSVMLGFLSGVAVNIVLSQLADLTGSGADGDFALAKAVDVVLHPGRMQLASLLAGVGALLLLLMLGRSRWSSSSAVVALAVPTVAVELLGADRVATVEDVGEIPGGLPMPGLPDLTALSPGLISGAVAVAAIVLVQGAGVAEAAPNRDGSQSNSNRDFIAQGAGNLASGVFRGLPVGGSVGQTALNIAAGARTRWAAICSGIWMLVILVAFSGLVGHVVMPTLAAVLIYAAVGSLRPGEVATIWRTGPTSQIALATTFAATLFLPIAAAVGIGVALSLLMQLNQEAIDLKVVEIVPERDGTWREQPVPSALTSHKVTIVDVYGSLFYAGSRTLQARLPDPAGTVRPAVVLRLRGRTSLGATFLTIVHNYATALAAVDGRLYLSGVSQPLVERLRHTSQLNQDDEEGPASLFEATPVLRESTEAAHREARAWVAGGRKDQSGHS